jgi:hypothetical protein
MDRFSVASLTAAPYHGRAEAIDCRNSATQDNNLKFYNELARKGAGKAIKKLRHKHHFFPSPAPERSFRGDGSSSYGMNKNFFISKDNNYYFHK